MKKIFHLASCSTCQRIIGELNGGGSFEMQNIGEEKITPAQLDYLAHKAGGYEALFSRRAQKYRAMGLHEKQLKEEDYRQLILEEYTFLKRPVILIGDDLFVGNAKKVTAAAQARLKTPSS